MMRSTEEENEQFHPASKVAAICLWTWLRHLIAGYDVVHVFLKRRLLRLHATIIASYLVSFPSCVCSVYLMI